MTNYRTAIPILLFCFGPDQSELAYPAHHLALETTSRNQGSELSGATMIPQMTVVVDLTAYGRGSLPLHELVSDSANPHNPNFACGYTAQVPSAASGTVLGKSVGAQRHVASSCAAMVHATTPTLRTASDTPPLLTAPP